MGKYDNKYDTRGLIYEAYHIEGISDPECRSIFFDWAFGLPSAIDQQEAIAAMLESYGKDQPDHPMSLVLKEGLESALSPRRRGGRKSRLTPS